MTWASVVNAPLCMNGPFNRPSERARFRREGARVLVMSVPPLIAVMTPLLPLFGSISKIGGRWHTAQPAPPLLGGVMKRCFPLFSLAVKFGKDAVSAKLARPASYFESKD